MEHFYTLQGEGYHQGRAAYFVRLAGCDVGCVWCDVKESWDKNKFPSFTIHQIVDTIQSNTPTHQPTQKKLVVITGGEPLMHPLNDLTAALQSAGYETNIETSGSHPLSGQWNWICLSPKKFKAPIAESLMKANELKVVVFHPSDLQWAEQHAAAIGSDCRLFLQPEWSKRDKLTPLIIDYIQQHPEWQLSLQTHKYINIP